MRMSTLGAIAGLIACGGGEPAGPPAAEAPPPADAAPARDLPNVVLVTLDTTRADHIGAYGYEGARTETLDALAARGQRFTRAYSPMPLTIPAHATLFTGLDIPHHDIRFNGDKPLSEDFTTLAELLKAEGYATAASISAFVTQRQWGFSQGFDAYFDTIPQPEGRGRAGNNQWHQERPAEDVVEDALAWLDSRPQDQPFFLWLHFYDAHLPNHPPRSYLEVYGDDIDHEDLYDAEIAYVDDQLQRVVGALDDTPTLWAIAGDHGEGRGEHLEVAHGYFVYNSTQQVPLILAGPGIAPEVVEQPVGLVDVAPTLLAALELEIPEGLDGRPQPGEPHPLYLETYQLRDRLGYSPHVGVVDGDWKYIHTPRPELYHQVEDGAEVEDRSAAEPEELKRMQELLLSLGVEAPSAEDRADLDPETVEQLAALGYIGGDFSDLDGPLPDPKDRGDVIRALQIGIIARIVGDPDRHKEAMREAITLDPKLVEPRIQLARQLGRDGELEEAAALLQEALEQRPESPQVLEPAMVALGQLGRLEQTLELCQRAITLKPESARFQEIYVGTLLNMGRQDEAIEHGVAYLEDFPDAHPVAAVLGNHLARVERLNEAVRFLLVAALAELPRMNVRRNLGHLAAATDNLEQALELIKAELEDYPGNQEARVQYALLLGKARRFEAQLEQVDILIKIGPDEPNFKQSRAMTLLNMGDAEGALAVLLEAQPQHPEHPGLMLMKANALKKLGRDEEAQAAFEQAKALKAKADAAPRPERQPRPRGKGKAQRGKAP